MGVVWVYKVGLKSSAIAMAITRKPHCLSYREREGGERERERERWCGNVGLGGL